MGALKSSLVNLNSKSGLTFVETILTTVVLSMLVLIMIGTMTLSKLMFHKSSQDSFTQGELKRTMQIITRDMSEAVKGIDSSCASCAYPWSCSYLSSPHYFCTVTYKAEEGYVAFSF